MANKKKKEGFFWVSYSDLMTSLFFVMLVLFVLSSAGLYMSEQATREQLKKIDEIQTAVNRLPKKYFKEDSVNKRWTLREEYTPHFPNKESSIPMADRYRLLEVGNSLKAVVDSLNILKKSRMYAGLDIKYMVVIEGMSSNLVYKDNDELSYKRALAVYYLWKRHNISFENSDCEVQISGSGTRGIRPYNTAFYKAQHEGKSDASRLYDINAERKNQCIIIQIIPKISNIGK